MNRTQINIVTDKAEQVAAYVAAQRSVTPISGNFSAIGLERDGELIAGAVYSRWNGKSIELSGAVTGRMTRKFLHAVFAYPFLQLNAECLLAYVDSCNEKCLRLMRHAGFTLEHTIAGAGRHGDMMIFRMNKNEVCHGQ